MQRGEIWFVSLPFSSDREQSGERPAVVLQDAVYGQKSPLVLIALLTSQQTALRFPGTVLVLPSPTNGLALPSVAMVFQTRALDRIRFRRKVGDIEPAHRQEITDELQRLVGLLPRP